MKRKTRRRVSLEDMLEPGRNLGEIMRLGEIKSAQSAAEAGDADAQYRLGLTYGGLNTRFEGVSALSIKEALHWLREAARQGHAKAAKELGVLYADGRKVKQNRQQARRWLEEAVRRGSHSAAVALGVYERYWDGLPKTAREWLTLGVAFRDGLTTVEGVARWFGKNWPLALECFERAYELGSVEGAFEAAQLLAKMHRTTANEERAVQWLKRAAEGGHAAAQFELAGRLARGRGVDQDAAESGRWLTRAAEQGHRFAQFELGRRHLRGYGVERDVARATRWLSEAAHAGHAHAQNELGYLYSHGTGVPQDYARAVEWYGKAADQGHSLARYNLGVLYLEGRGVTWSRNKAIELMGQKAVEDYAAQGARREKSMRRPRPSRSD